MSQASARLGGDPDLPTEQQSSVLAAQAAVDEAKLNLQRTQVDAAVTGVVTNFDLQPGEYVKAGEVVFSLVATDDVWVHANFRETDLTNVKVGQSATVHVDAFPDRDRIAVVESISPATGAEFALLPPQNATGNWVKVVQRLTVRLKLADPLEQPRLRPGMSVIVEIDTQHRRSLSGLLSGVRRWLELAL
jgi:membrane fusion protein (multidrug efflux system)